MSLSLSQMTLRELVEIERAGQAIVDAVDRVSHPRGGWPGFY